MSLRQQAERDLSFILEDANRGFGWPVTVSDPSGVSASLVGFSNDIAQVIDPDTGQAVSGRAASITLRVSTLQAAGLGLPVGIADSTSKPWVVRFDSIYGEAHTFKVTQGDPDRSLGVVSCMLEAYRP